MHDLLIIRSRFSISSYIFRAIPRQGNARVQYLRRLTAPRYMVRLETTCGGYLDTYDGRPAYR